MKKVSKTMIQKYKDTFPALGKLRCKSEGGNHRPTCGCLNPPFISKAYTNFSSILMEAQSQEEFVKRLEALLGERESVQRKPKTVELHCTCRMPERKVDKFAECDSCHIWYHHHCMDIPSEVFGDSEVHWECKRCVKQLGT